MTPEAQRIAIAEACGWKPAPRGRWKLNERVERFRPDYLNDLNAMHEAEVWLYGADFILYTVYIDNLTDICSCAHKMSAYRESATAAQRAEAFLRTLGKWEKAK